VPGAGAAVTLQHLNAQLALGQPIDLSQHAQAVSAKVRVASRLGLQRRARDVLARHPSRSCLRAASSNGRTSAAKAFDRLVADIESDLGGSDRLSAIERALLEGFAGCRAAVTLQHLNTQLALGQPIDLSQHAGGERHVARGVEARFAAKGARRAARQPSRQLLTCRELDGRTSATKAFDRLGFRLATRRQLGGIGSEFSSIPVTP